MVSSSKLSLSYKSYSGLANGQESLFAINGLTLKVYVDLHLILQYLVSGVH